MEEKRVFGELELAIFNILKEKQPLSVLEVQQKLRDLDRYTTIMTVLNRLVAKKELRREKEGKKYLYWIEEKVSSFNLLKRIKEKVFQGKTSMMIRYLIDQEENIDFKEIEKIIEQAKKKEL